MKSQGSDTKTCQKKKKIRLKSTKEKDNSNWFSKKKEALENKQVLFFLSIKRLCENLTKIWHIRVNKKEFHKSKQLIDLDLVNVDQIVTSDKFKQSDDALKYFINYKRGEIVKPLCIINLQVSGYIKCFENGGKTCLLWLKMMMCETKTMKLGTR